MLAEGQAAIAMPLATAREAVKIVLAAAGAKGEFTGDQIATQILDLMHTVGIDTRNLDQRERDLAATTTPTSEWAEQLTYRIEHRDAGERILEVSVDRDEAINEVTKLSQNAMSELEDEFRMLLGDETGQDKKQQPFPHLE